MKKATLQTRTLANGVLEINTDAVAAAVREVAKYRNFDPSRVPRYYLQSDGATRTIRGGYRGVLAALQAVRVGSTVGVHWNFDGGITLDVLP